jgi:hypothetical protein
VLVLLTLFSLSLVNAACTPTISLINQDPYPAVPGEYVKLVFQVEFPNIDDCKDFTFELLEDYPISFDPGENGLRSFSRLKYLKNYDSNVLIPYEVRIEKNALDGANPVEINFQNKGEAPVSKTFDVEVHDTKAEFEVYVKDYSFKTHNLIIEILNIKDSNIEALTVEIPKQENIKIKGSNRIVVGDLDSNEYTTADFEAVPKDGQIKVNLYYSDAVNIRRKTTKTITFDSSYFTNRIADRKSTSTLTYIFLVIIIIAIAYWFYRRQKKKKERRRNLHRR